MSTSSTKPDQEADPQSTSIATPATMETDNSVTSRLEEEEKEERINAKYEKVMSKTHKRLELERDWQRALSAEERRKYFGLVRKCIEARNRARDAELAYKRASNKRFLNLLKWKHKKDILEARAEELKTWRERLQYARQVTHDKGDVFDYSNIESIHTKKCMYGEVLRNLENLGKEGLEKLGDRDHFCRLCREDIDHILTILHPGEHRDLFVDDYFTFPSWAERNGGIRGCRKLLNEASMLIIDELEAEKFAKKAN